MSGAGHRAVTTGQRVDVSMLSRPAAAGATAVDDGSVEERAFRQDHRLDAGRDVPDELDEREALVAFVRGEVERGADTRADLRGLTACGRPGRWSVGRRAGARCRSQARTRRRVALPSACNGRWLRRGRGPTPLARATFRHGPSPDAGRATRRRGSRRRWHRGSRIARPRSRCRAASGPGAGRSPMSPAGGTRQPAPAH